MSKCKYLSSLEIFQDDFYNKVNFIYIWQEYSIDVLYTFSFIKHFFFGQQKLIVLSYSCTTVHSPIIFVHLDFIPNQLKVLARVLNLSVLQWFTTAYQKLTIVDCKKHAKAFVFPLLYYFLFNLIVWCGKFCSLARF